ncbi:hypothetical protein C1646_760586 [Rhizophagus diaphanus]|nr:hypothetical protein C1646_760586 [Rhizophagus diaphanus] [Rhizophagus sp. MUCL 43196]
MTFWDWVYSESKITFIDIIKGIISCELSAYTWGFWIDRCLRQKAKKRRLNINLKKVKENYNVDKYIDPNRKINTNNLFKGLDSLRLNEGCSLNDVQ